ncbi:MAG: hypothetical protein AAF514_21655 [Verrucomicrobiota bacterium]
MNYQKQIGKMGDEDEREQVEPKRKKNGYFISIAVGVFLGNVIIGVIKGDLTRGIITGVIAGLLTGLILRWIASRKAG